MTSGILHNISKNKLNRTRMYKAELKFKARWVQQRSAGLKAKPKPKPKSTPTLARTPTPIKAAPDQEDKVFTKRNQVLRQQQQQ